MNERESELGANEEFQKNLEAQSELPSGKYAVTVRFRKTDGETENLELGTIRLHEAAAIQELQSLAAGKASGTGLHNFGMDVYVGRYPQGHPVEFTVTNENDPNLKIAFTRFFDGNGYEKKK